MGWFILITTLYFVFKTIFTPISSDEKNTKSKILFAIYLLVLLLGELTINIGLTKDICGGTSQIGTASLATFIPWILIFGTMETLLQIFPGWLRPFSNTFGYLFTKGGISKTMNDLLNAPGINKSTSNDMKYVQKALAKIYEDQSLLVNEATTSNFDDFWEKMTPLFNTDNDNNVQDSLKKDLLKHITTKESIARYIWYILTGGLITSASYNYIVNSECTYSQKQQEQNDETYAKSLLQKSQQDSESVREYRTYE
jgi:hypothetical protein